MIGWGPEQVSDAAGARLLSRVRGRSNEDEGPRRVVIDSRRIEPGDLFVGLPGARVDGGSHAAAALAAGAWGVLVAPEHAADLPAADLPAAGLQAGYVLAHPDPLRGLQSLARAWRDELGVAGLRVVGITGSTGKTSTKDILAAVLSSSLRTAASPANLNTEIGLPLAILAAPAGTEALVLEMAMRGPGQIAELAEIARPDVGVIVNVGPVHLELLGSLEAIAAAKAELIQGLRPGATIVLPAGEPLLDPHLREDLHTVAFGEGGDVELLEIRDDREVLIGDRRDPSGAMSVRPSFDAPHNLRNLLAAVAAAGALEVAPPARLEVAFSALRGERLDLSDGIVLINDCYNANPISMRAALDELARSAPGRRIAVLGDMLELGSDQARFHREVAAHAAQRGVEVLIAVGPLAAGMLESFRDATGGDREGLAVADAETAADRLGDLLRSGDTVLVKGSRGVGLERVAQLLASSPAGGS